MASERSNAGVASEAPRSKLTPPKETLVLSNEVFGIFVRLAPEPLNDDAVIIPLVLTETVVPIPTLIISVGLVVLTKVIFPAASFFRVVVPSSNSSIPVIFLVLGSNTIEEVPILKIPVTLPLPTTTKSSL